ncbi:MAG: hypothetical protein WDO12_13565 [Pseudomonadota bacterium]
MRKSQFFTVLMMGCVLGTGLVACEHKGPAEKAGEKLDDAAKDVKKDAEKVGDKIDDAAKDVKDKVDGK